MCDFEDDLESQALIDESEWATKEAKLCPNRVWAVAGKNLVKLITDHDKLQERVMRVAKASSDAVVEGESHARMELDDYEMCNFDFCEYSQRDFTGVDQRHECRAKDCPLLKGVFPRDVLRAAAEADESMVWSSDGLSSRLWSKHRSLGL